MKRVILFVAILFDGALFAACACGAILAFGWFFEWLVGVLS